MVEGIYRIGLHDKTIGEVINMGSGKDSSIHEIAKIVGRLINDDINIKQKLKETELDLKKVKFKD